MNPQTLLLKQVLHQDQICDILIRGNRFAQIAPQITDNADQIINGAGRLAILPPFYNLHTHAAMTLLRGYADDLELFAWLNDYIWPTEAQLTPEDIYWGSKLALLEMIKTGTVFFSDMYWMQKETIKAVEEMGVRAAIGMTLIVGPDGQVLPNVAATNKALLAEEKTFSERIILTCAPHAIYTVPGPLLQSSAAQARAEGRYFHIHAAETQQEFDDCMKQHGMTPIAYLDSLGCLGPKTILAHCIHLTDEDIKLIQERQAIVVHMPCSNQKLSSGRFRYHDTAELGGCKVVIGTDGCSSNNNLSMLDEMKFAALLAKSQSGLPTAGKAQDIFDRATRLPAQYMGWDAGIIAEGKLADAMLINLDNHFLLGDYNLISNLVYSADSSCIDTVICDGKILMQNRQVPGEAEIMAETRRVCRRLAQLRPHK